ncbi:MAG: IS110 family transposase, partial [Gammaproteobacteria bacterium]|nr:IS110 family transposase [Gammaproteobacteria bacterium]
MNDITRVGIDLGKKVFHLTAVDRRGAVVERKQLRRGQLQSYPAGRVVAMEACASAHHWGRLARSLGHRAMLMSPHKVAPYTHRNKTDANDADGIAEASSRPRMREVGLKPVERQHLRQLHRARQLAVRDRTAQANQLHGFLLEYGIESQKGIGALLRRLPEVLEDAGNELPPMGRALLRDLGAELRHLDGRVKRFEEQIRLIADADPACRRLLDIPGVGPLTATALVAAVGDA